MVITVINASNWSCIDEGDAILYWCGHHGAPASQQCRQSYYPFAWLRVYKQSHRLLAARDHFGQEPFYYCYQDQRFIFGSTLADIVPHLSQTPKMTQHLVRDCFMRTPVDDPVDDPPYASETYYEGIFRVTPAHYLHIHGMEKREESFWLLDRAAPTLHYADEREYTEHFSILLDEAIRTTTAGESSLASEFSGGIDSTALFVACRKNELEPTLFTHIPPKTREPTHEDTNVFKIIKQFHWADRHHAVNADDFDPMAVFLQFSKVFAGPPPNMNCVLSNNLHQEVVRRGFKVLMSGFGGDDGISLICPPQIMYHQQWKKQGLVKIWQDSLCVEADEQVLLLQKLGRFLDSLCYIHPKYHALATRCKEIKYRLIQKVNYKKSRMNLPSLPFYASLRDYEYDLLQGSLCHEMRMRLEYSALTAKAMGFRYIYPLLYPPLIEFGFSLPLEQKFKQGRMRCTVRDYLLQHVQGMKFSTKGGATVPSTMQKCRDYAAKGAFQPYFTGLPFKEYIDAAHSIDDQLLLQIHAFMMKHGGPSEFKSLA